MKKRTWTQEEKLKVSADAKINGLRPTKVGQASAYLRQRGKPVMNPGS
jgi:hypothetical protein